MLFAPYRDAMEGAITVTVLLFGQTSLLTTLLIVVLCGSERIYQRMLEMIRVIRGDESSQCDTTPPCQGVESPLADEQPMRCAACGGMFGLLGLD